MILFRRESNTADNFTQSKKFLLHYRVTSLSEKMFFPHVVKIPSAYFCFFIVAHSQPGLGLCTFLKVIRCTPSSHLCRYPAGIDRIGIYPRPFAGCSHRQDYNMKFGISVTIPTCVV